MEYRCDTAVCMRLEGVEFESAKYLEEAVIIACTAVEVSGVFSYEILGREDENPLTVRIDGNQQFVVELDGKERKYDYVWIRAVDDTREWWPGLEWAQPEE